MVCCIRFEDAIYSVRFYDEMFSKDSMTIQDIDKSMIVRVFWRGPCEANFFHENISVKKFEVCIDGIGAPLSIAPSEEYPLESRVQKLDVSIEKVHRLRAFATLRYTSRHMGYGSFVNNQMHIVKHDLEKKQEIPLKLQKNFEDIQQVDFIASLQNLDRIHVEISEK